jgi:hypothetical protein
MCGNVLKQKVRALDFPQDRGSRMLLKYFPGEYGQEPITVHEIPFFVYDPYAVSVSVQAYAQISPAFYNCGL